MLMLLIISIGYYSFFVNSLGNPTFLIIAFASFAFLTKKGSFHNCQNTLFSATTPARNVAYLCIIHNILFKGRCWEEIHSTDNNILPNLENFP